MPARSKSSSRQESTLADLGEDALLALLTGHWSREFAGGGVTTGVGDDCAVLQGADGRALLLKTDAIVEGSHFLPETAPSLIGRKALARVLSDMAAMGGEPWAALVTLGVPAATSTQRIRAVYRGLEKLALASGTRLVGGETTRTDRLLLSISMLGRVPAGRAFGKGSKPPRAALRSGGRAGHKLFVTGRLGRSLPTGHHLKFKPRLAEGQWLARHGFASAMMDLSDGLGADLPRLARASGVTFSIDVEAIPRTRGATIEQALGDGEDYELLLAVPPRRANALPTEWPFATALTCIGTLCQAKTKSAVGRPVKGCEFSASGYDHFK